MRRVSMCAVVVISVLFATMVVLPSAALGKDDLREAQKQATKASNVFQEIMNTPDKGNLRGRMNPLVRF